MWQMREEVLSTATGAIVHMTCIMLRGRIQRKASWGSDPATPLVVCVVAGVAKLAARPTRSPLEVSGRCAVLALVCMQASRGAWPE